MHTFIKTAPLKLLQYNLSFLSVFTFIEIEHEIDLQFTTDNSNVSLCVTQPV